MNIPIPTDPARRARAGVIMAVVVGAVGTYKGIESMTSPALPILQEELGASRAEIAWVLTGILLTGPVVTPIIGRLGDIWDKRRVLLGVLAIVGLGTVVAALSASMPMLIAGQLLQGFGLSTVPLAVGILRETQPPAKVESGNGIMVGTIFGATALAMLIAGPIADHLHYSWLFWFPFVVLVTVMIAVWRLVPACPPTTTGRRLDVLGAVIFGGALAILLVALTNAPDWGWTSSGFLGLVGAAMALAAAFVVVELRVSDPLVDVRILVGRQVVVAVALMIMAGFILNAFLVSIPMQMQQPVTTGYGLGATATMTSFVLVPGILIGTTAPVAAWFEHRIGMRATSMLSAAVALASCLVVLAAAGSFWLLLIALLICGFGTGVAITHAMNIVVVSVPADRVGAFSGVNFVVKAVGATSGAQIAASILSTDAASASESPSWGAFASVYWICAGLCAVVLLVGAVVRITPRDRDTPGVVATSSSHED